MFREIITEGVNTVFFENLDWIDDIAERLTNFLTISQNKAMREDSFRKWKTEA